MDRYVLESRPPVSPGKDLDGNAPLSRKSTRTAARSSRKGIQKQQTLETPATSNLFRELMSSSGVHLASPSVSKGFAQGSRMIVEFLLSTSSEWFTSLLRDSWFGKTSPVSCRQKEDGTLEPCSGGWKNSGMGGPIGRLTLDFSEAPTNVAESSLLDVLEDDSTLPPGLFLSLSTQSKILGRLAKYGKVPPPGMGLPSTEPMGSQETKHPSSSSTQAPPFELHREAKEISSGDISPNGRGEEDSV